MSESPVSLSPRPRSEFAVDAVHRCFVRYQVVILIAALTALAGETSLMHSWEAHHYVDLQVYRFGVQAWLHGGDMYGLLPPTDAGSSLPFIYPPFAAILLMPLAVVSWAWSAWGIDLLSFGSLALTLYLVARRMWPGAGRRTVLTVAVVALIPALWLEPVRSNFSFGQVNIFLMALVAADCLVERPRWPRGLLVGVAAAVKLTPAAFILYFLIRKDFRAAAVSAMSAAAITAGTFLVAPATSYRFWFGGLSTLSGISGTPYFSNQTIRGSLARLSLPNAVLIGGWVVLSALVLVAAVLIMWRAERGGDTVLSLTVNAAAGLLVAPTAWSHHWVWVAPGLLLFALHAARTRRTGWFVVAGVVAAVFLIGPLHLVPGGGDQELRWTPLQHLVGDAYPELALVLFAVGAALVLRRHRQRRTSAASTTADGAEPATAPAAADGVDATAR